MSAPFPLRAVLRLREQKEATEERAFGAIVAELQRLGAAFADVERAIARQANDLTHSGRAVRLAAEHQALAAHLQRLRQQREHLSAQLRQTEAQRAEQQARYLAARRDRETLTELHEKHEKVWAAAQEARDRKRTDDLFAARRRRDQ